MACKVHRRMAMPRKLQILRTLTKSKSVEKSSIIMDAFLYICKLRLQVEAIQKEYHYLVNHIQEVKVEKLETGYLTVRITCKRGENMLVSILEIFEEMKLSVVEAKLTSNHFFRMEAILKPLHLHHHHHVDPSILNQVLLTLIQNQTEKN